MRKLSFLAVLALTAMGAMVLAGAGTAAKPASAAPARAQSSWTGGNVVRQVGLRNYAGPNCPGKGWNCTTATRVLQVATAGGTNSFVCSPSNVSVPAPTPTNCVIKQIGGVSNTARCTQQSSDAGVVQTCDITQSGAANYAYVNQNINQTDGSSQTGTQIAIVNQSGASVVNQLQLGQAVNQIIKTSALTQTQDAYQSAEIEQTAVGSGTNFASPSQSQLQKEYARSTIQNQNTTPLPIADCDPDNAPTKPNACVDVRQHAESGTNQNHLRQSISEDANSSGTATQTQGASDAGVAIGGINGHVHQDTVGGSSTNEVNQSKALKETVPKGSGSTQIQYDPVSCCGFASQEGGSGNSETISQSSSVSASGPATQSSSLIGTSNTEGSCQITQAASTNNASATNSANFTPCPLLEVTTSCGSSGGEGGCENPEPGRPISAATIGVRNVTAGEESFAQSTNAVTGDTVEYQVIYSNIGTGAATNVLGTAPVPSGTGPPVNLTCPFTCNVNFDGGFPISVSWSLGTVAPNTDPLFTTVTFNVVVTTTDCAFIDELPVVTTDQDGNVAVTPVNGARVNANSDQCIQ